MENALSSLVFYVFAVMAFVCAIGVVAFRNPVTSAMNMALSFFATAVILFGMGAQFLGIIQIIVYAGAIMVLFLFVVMMLDLQSEERKLTALPQSILGVVIAAVFAGMVVRVAIDLPGATGNPCPFQALISECCGEAAPVATSHEFGGALPALNAGEAVKVLNPNATAEQVCAAKDIPDAKLLGLTLFTKYNIAFVLLAFALLGGTVGAIALGRRIRKD